LEKGIWFFMILSFVVITIKVKARDHFLNDTSIYPETIRKNEPFKKCPDLGTQKSKVE
jgi:hypothetical protein